MDASRFKKLRAQIEEKRKQEEEEEETKKTETEIDLETLSEMSQRARELFEPKVAKKKAVYDQVVKKVHPSTLVWAKNACFKSSPGCLNYFCARILPKSEEWNAPSIPTEDEHAVQFWGLQKSTNAVLTVPKKQLVPYYHSPKQKFDPAIHTITPLPNAWHEEGKEAMLDRLKKCSKITSHIAKTMVDNIWEKSHQFLSLALEPESDDHAEDKSYVGCDIIETNAGISTATEEIDISKYAMVTLTEVEELRIGDWVEFRDVLFPDNKFRTKITSITKTNSSLIDVETGHIMDPEKFVSKLKLDDTGAPIHGSGHGRPLKQYKLCDDNEKTPAISSSSKSSDKSKSAEKRKRVDPIE